MSGLQTSTAQTTATFRSCKGHIDSWPKIHNEHCVTRGKATNRQIVQRFVRLGKQGNPSTDSRFLLVPSWVLPWAVLYCGGHEEQTISGLRHPGTNPALHIVTMTTGAPDVHLVDKTAEKEGCRYQRENTMIENLSIYTDASGTDSVIGVAAAYPFTQRT